MLTTHIRILRCRPVVSATKKIVTTALRQVFAVCPPSLPVSFCSCSTVTRDLRLVYQRLFRRRGFLVLDHLHVGIREHVVDVHSAVSAAILLATTEAAPPRKGDGRSDWATRNRLRLTAGRGTEPKWAEIEIHQDA